MITAKKRISLLLMAVFLCICFLFAISPREARAGAGNKDWSWPVPASNSLSSCFGDGRAHYAIDIATPIGSSVLASWGGIVRTAKSCPHNSPCSCNGGAGKYIEIEHYYNGTSYLSRYLHLNSINVNVGQTVTAGQQIAASGNTGDSGGPHLHFQLKNLNTGANIDPLGEHFLQLPNGLNANAATTSCCYQYVNTIKNIYNSIQSPQDHIKAFSDSITTKPGEITVKGWAFDIDSPQSAVTIHVYVGGGVGNSNAWSVSIGSANLNRGDVQNAFPSYNIGKYHGYQSTIRTPKRGWQDVYVYALAVTRGDFLEIGHEKIYISEPEHTPPVVSDVKVSNVSSTGYTVSCKVTDESGIDRVQFPTWTEKNGQDDLSKTWTTDKNTYGQKSGDTYTYRVNISDHNNEKGRYFTHIYAYDYYGNVSLVHVNGSHETGDTGVIVPEKDLSSSNQTASAKPNTSASSSQTSSGIIKGDLMRKGKPTLGSFALLGQYLLKTKTLDDYQLKAADMNGDGKVSIADFTLLGKKLLGV